MLLCRAIKEVLCAHPDHNSLAKPLQALKTCIHEAVETRYQLLALYLSCNLLATYDILTCASAWLSSPCKYKRYGVAY